MKEQENSSGRSAWSGKGKQYREQDCLSTKHILMSCNIIRGRGEYSWYGSVDIEDLSFIKAVSNA